MKSIRTTDYPHFSKLFFHLYQTNVFFFFFHRNIIMCTLNIASSMKIMTVNELRDFIFENYYQRIGVAKYSNFCSVKGS